MHVEKAENAMQGVLLGNAGRPVDGIPEFRSDAGVPFAKLHAVGAGDASVESKRLNVKVLKERCCECACGDGRIMPRKWSMEAGVMTSEE